MKIAHVVDSMEVGGAEVLVSQLCRLQREQGHCPCVYAVASLGPLGEGLLQDGIEVRAGMGKSLPDGAWNFLRALRNSRPDVVHLHNPTPTIYAAMAARMAGVPSIVSTRHSLVGRPWNKVAEAKYAIAATFCDWIVGICDATVGNLRALHSVRQRKIARVYNGAVPLRRAPQELCPQKGGFILLYVGRLVPVKNHALLLTAFRSALKVLPELRLWMVGDGSERDALEGLAGRLGIAAQTTFWGQQLDVAPFFSAADAFIMSSRSEGVPMSLLQAFSLGLPVVVTEVGGMAEVVRLARAGLTVQAGDADAMAKAIVRLASNSAERAIFSENAMRAFDKHFQLQAMADSYMGLYQNTVRSQRMRRSTVPSAANHPQK